MTTEAPPAPAPAAIAAPAFVVTLPGVYSWSRPRPGRGKVRYEGPYAVGRPIWAGAVYSATVREGWTAPPVAARLGVHVLIAAGGKRDADRVITAVLDALQGGGAIKDDCRVKDGSWTTVAPEKGEDEHVTVTLRVVSPR